MTDKAISPLRRRMIRATTSPADDNDRRPTRSDYGAAAHLSIRDNNNAPSLPTGYSSAR